MNAVSSGLVKLMASAASPIHARHWLDSEPKKPTAAMRFGTAVHAAILEPDVYAAAPTIAGLKPGATADTFARHEREHGPVVLAEGWAEQIESILGIMESDRGGFPDWDCGERELVVVWDETTASGFQVRCKARLDYYCEDWLADIKTARSIEPDKFARDAYSFGYHIQLGGHYSRACEEAAEFLPANFGGTPDITIVAVENEPPNDIAVFDVSERWARHGRQVWGDAIDRLAYSLAMDDWPDSSQHRQELDLPPYIGDDE
jgi:exodeoxyribonuclease VIII